MKSDAVRDVPQGDPESRAERAHRHEPSTRAQLNSDKSLSILYDKILLSKYYHDD